MRVDLGGMVTILEVEHACKKVLFSFFKYLFIYLPVLRLSCGMWDLVRAQTRARLGSPALGLQSLSHWTTRRVSISYSFSKPSKPFHSLIVSYSFFSVLPLYLENGFAKLSTLALGYYTYIAFVFGPTI